LNQRLTASTKLGGSWRGKLSVNRPALVLGRYENSQGVTAWQVPGNLPGLRVRRNCKTRDEASAKKATLELKSIQTAAGLDTVATVLTGPHIREAEALFQRFAANSRPLSFSVDFTLANDREPERQSPPRGDPRLCSRQGARACPRPNIRDRCDTEVGVADVVVRGGGAGTDVRVREGAFGGDTARGGILEGDGSVATEAAAVQDPFVEVGFRFGRRGVSTAGEEAEAVEQA
jgi:hypothetical protein